MRNFVAVVLFLLLTTPTFAQEASPETKAKIEEIKRAVASKAAELKEEVNESLQNKSFVGVVSTASTTSLTLATHSGPKIVTLNQDTIYEGIKKTAVKEESYLAALGDIDDTGVLTAKKIVKLSDEDKDMKDVIIGKVTNNSKDSISVIEKNGTIIRVKIEKDTVLKYGSKSISLKDIRVNLDVVVIGYLKEEEITGSTVFVTTEAEPEDPHKVASPSATPKV